VFKFEVSATEGLITSGLTRQVIHAEP